MSKETNWSTTLFPESQVRRYIIVGERRLTNYWWAFVIFCGSCCFLLTGIFSYSAHTTLNSATYKKSTDKLEINEVRFQTSKNLNLNSELDIVDNQIFPQIVKDVGHEENPNTYQANSSSEFAFSQNPLINIFTKISQTGQQITFFPQGLLMSFYGCLGFLLSIYWWLLIFWNVGGGFNEFQKRSVIKSPVFSSFTSLYPNSVKGAFPQGKVKKTDSSVESKTLNQNNLAKTLSTEQSNQNVIDVWSKPSNSTDGFIRIFRWGYPGKNRKIDLLYPLKDVEAIRVELKQGIDPQRNIFIRLKGKREIPLTGIGQPLTLKEIEKQASELANFLQVSLEGL